jgi:predicted permease
MNLISSLTSPTLFCCGFAESYDLAAKSLSPVGVLVVGISLAVSSARQFDGQAAAYSSSWRSWASRTMPWLP